MFALLTLSMSTGWETPEELNVNTVVSNHFNEHRFKYDFQESINPQYECSQFLLP